MMSQPKHPYPFRKRLVDRLHGVVDGRRALPQLPADIDFSAPAPGTLTTPYMLQLVQLHEAFVAEVVLDGARTNGHPPRGAAVAEVERLTVLAAELRARLDRMPAEPPDLDDPPSEVEVFLDLSAAEVERRRRNAHRRQRREQERALMRARNELAAADAGLTGADHAEERSTTAQRAVIDGHAAHVRERLLVYAGAVVRWHPDGGLLQRWLSGIPPLTDDVTAGAPVRGIGPGGPPAIGPDAAGTDGRHEQPDRAEPDETPDDQKEIRDGTT